MANPIVTIEMEDGKVMKGELYPDRIPSITSSRFPTPAFMTVSFSTA